MQELVTPPLDGTILPGVTRDSVLQLTRGWGEFEVSERQLSIKEIKQVPLMKLAYDVSIPSLLYAANHKRKVCMEQSRSNRQMHIAHCSSLE